MKFEDAKAVNFLREEYDEITQKIDGVKNGTALNVAVYGQYVEPEMIEKCKPVVCEFLEAKRQEVVEKLKDLGVTF